MFKNQSILWLWGRLWPEFEHLHHSNPLCLTRYHHWKYVQNKTCCPKITLFSRPLYSYPIEIPPLIVFVISILWRPSRCWKFLAVSCSPLGGDPELKARLGIWEDYLLSQVLFYVSGRGSRAALAISRPQAERMSAGIHLLNSGFNGEYLPTFYLYYTWPQVRTFQKQTLFFQYEM